MSCHDFRVAYTKHLQLSMMPANSAVEQKHLADTTGVRVFGYLGNYEARWQSSLNP